MEYKDEGVKCGFVPGKSQEPAIAPENQFFASTEVTGRLIQPRFAESILGVSVRTTILYVIVYVHVVAMRLPNGKPQLVVSPQWIDELFAVANGIWSQACIRLFPIMGSPVTEIVDAGLNPFISCIANNETLAQVVEEHDATIPSARIVNLYILRQTNGIACAMPPEARIFMPSDGLGSQFMGNVLAHEFAHVVLNPVGISNSDNPDHLLYHNGNSDGTHDGLYLSDCVAARTTATENLAVFGFHGDRDDCVMQPRLGNNLVLVANELAPIAPD